MNIICWNCRGAGKASTVRELRELAKKFTPIVLCIVETQLEKARVEGLASSIGYVKPMQLVVVVGVEVLVFFGIIQ